MKTLAFAAALALAAPVFAETPDRWITVVGEGSVETAPDMATISLGVVTEGDTGAAAMEANSKSLTAVFDALKAAGIAEKDMQTSDLSLNPRWDHRNDSAPKITGFTASNNVTVRVRDLPQLGGILDAVLKSGANNFHGLNFGLTQPRPSLDEARTQAVKDARAKAELYATAAGVTLGDVVSISEATRQATPGPMMRMEAAGYASDAVPVANGEVAVSASITMVYEIQ